MNVTRNGRPEPAWARRGGRSGVTLKVGAHVSAAELRDFVKQRVAAYK